MEVILNSAINDRSNIESNNRFKKEYTIIDSNDIFFTISNEDGTIVPGKISLLNQNFDLHIIQKTNFLYQKELDKDIKVYSNVSLIKF